LQCRSEDKEINRKSRSRGSEGLTVKCSSKIEEEIKNSRKRKGRKKKNEIPGKLSVAFAGLPQ